MTNEENENFAYLLEIGEIEQAFEMVPDDAYEAGLSVFDVNDMLEDGVGNLYIAFEQLKKKLEQEKQYNYSDVKDIEEINNKTNESIKDIEDNETK